MYHNYGTKTMYSAYIVHMTDMQQACHLADLADQMIHIRRCRNKDDCLDCTGGLPSMPITWAYQCFWYSNWFWNMFDCWISEIAAVPKVSNHKSQYHVITHDHTLLKKCSIGKLTDSEHVWSCVFYLSCWAANVATAMMAGVVPSVSYVCLPTSSNLLISYAEKPIYSELKADFWTTAISLWVYETDVQILDKEVYKSDMIWPSKQHEIIYICLGMEAIRPSDRRCKSNEMTIIYTENVVLDHRHTKQGTLMRLFVQGFNDFLKDKEIEARGKICNSKCRDIYFAIFLVSSIDGSFLIAFKIIAIFRWNKTKACLCCKWSIQTQGRTIQAAQHHQARPTMVSYSIAHHW